MAILRLETVKQEKETTETALICTGISEKNCGLKILKIKTPNRKM